MKAAMFALAVATLALGVLSVGCDYYKQQKGYLVSDSESFIHHYEGSPCGVQGKLTCDMPEMRYRLIHQGIKVVAHCQAWDERNNCGRIEVGKAYDCRTGAANALGPPLLDCGDNGVLEVESSKKD